MFASGKDNTCIDFLPLELRDTCGFPFSAFSFSLSFGFTFPGTTISLLLPPASETLERRVIIRHPLLLVKKKRRKLVVNWMNLFHFALCLSRKKKRTYKPQARISYHISVSFVIHDWNEAREITSICLMHGA